MKIRLIGFRGLEESFLSYEQEPALIRAGHIGVQFEGDNKIYGFHPTEEAIKNAGGEDDALELLLEHEGLEGALQDDTAIFNRAFELTQQGTRTIVYELLYDLDE